MEETKVAILSEKTLIPLSLLVAIMGGVYWLTAMHEDLGYTKGLANSTDQRLHSTEIQLSAIEGKIDILIGIIKHEKK